jgi:hypothetical protein
MSRKNLEYAARITALIIIALMIMSFVIAIKSCNEARAQGTGGVSAPSAVWNVQVKADATLLTNKKGEKVVRLSDIDSTAYDSTYFVDCDVCAKPIVSVGRDDKAGVKLVFKANQVLNRAALKYRGSGFTRTINKWNGNFMPYRMSLTVKGRSYVMRMDRIKVRYTNLRWPQPAIGVCSKSNCPQWGDGSLRVGGTV